VLGSAGFAAAVMVPTTLVALILGGIVAQLLGTRAPDVVPAPQTDVEILLVVLAAVLLVPLGEEIFFRGYALTAWLRDLGPRSALVRSTIFFAAIHIANVRADTFEDGLRQSLLVLAVVGPVGAVLGWLFLRRGLVAAVAGHVTYNGLLILLLLATQFLPAPS
jgi:membrane protease YdiL (CAAX protease family)